jgi:alkanesulfonate monooxygenase SsuD/methylene tetrahydromethanopterin reductase-like flavin-dependent oxidoreductase (luciferase family)
VAVRTSRKFVIEAPPEAIMDALADVEAARNFAAEQLSFYETIPSYQKVIAREGVTSVAELAAIGSAGSVVRQLRSYLDAGATDVVLSPLDRANASEALWALAAQL